MVHFTLRIDLFEIYRRRNIPAVQGEHGVGRLHRACSTEQVAGHGFCRAHSHGISSFAEQAAHGRDFRFVAEGRRSRMGVDVAEFLRLHAGILQRPFHGQTCARAIFRRCCRMVGIRRISGTGEGGVDTRPARPGCALLFQNQNSSPLAHDKAIAIDIKRAAGTRRLFVTRRECACGNEPGYPQRNDGRLCPADDHDVGFIVLQHAHPLADTVRTRGAGRGDGKISTAHPVAYREQARSHVADNRRHEKRRNPPRSAIFQSQCVLNKSLHTAHA